MKNLLFLFLLLYISLLFLFGYIDSFKTRSNFSDNAQEILNLEVGKVFEQVLLDAGVFKRNELGKQAFFKFINTLYSI